mgnify:CR=1 FL=1
MSRSPNIDRLDTLERQLTNTRNDDDPVRMLNLKLAAMAASFLEGGICWETYPKSEHLAATTTHVERAQHSLEQALAHAQSILDDEPPVHWQQTSEQRVSNVGMIADRLKSARTQLELASSLHEAAESDPRGLHDCLPKRATPYPLERPASMSLATYFALLLTMSEGTSS